MAARMEQFEHPIVKLQGDPAGKMAESDNNDEEKEKIINEEQSYFHLYPNPNDGSMQLDYSIGDNQLGKLIIHDLLGRTLYLYDLKPQSNILRIEEPQLNNGAYSYQIIVDDAVVKSSKLLIIK